MLFWLAMRAVGRGPTRVALKWSALRIYVNNNSLRSRFVLFEFIAFVLTVFNHHFSATRVGPLPTARIIMYVFLICYIAFPITKMKNSVAYPDDYTFRNVLFSYFSCW